MKTKSGYETNGDYIKFKSGFTSNWNVETQNNIEHFKNELDAEMHIIIKIIGCENGYSKCVYYNTQKHGCQNCKIGYNKNCSNTETHNK